MLRGKRADTRGGQPAARGRTGYQCFVALFLSAAAFICWPPSNAAAQDAPTDPGFSLATPIQLSDADQATYNQQRTDIANLILPAPSPPSGGITTDSVQAATQAQGSNSGLAGQLQITDLAGALKNDPDLIYEYVYNNIETLPQYGSLKGAVGALIDGKGTAVDQAELMVQLLQAAALGNTAISNPQFQTGEIWLTQAQLSAWTGEDASQGSATAVVYGGFPSAGGRPDSSVAGKLACYTIGWTWVQVSINGQAYVFDPAAKLSNQNISDLQGQPANCNIGQPSPASSNYHRTSGANLASVMGYSQAAFLGDATRGATITDRSVQGLNRANVRSDLTTYSNNLVHWIKTNSPSASTADIVGGKTIIPLPVNTHQRWTSLPYICSAAEASGCPAVSTVTSAQLPRTTLEIKLPSLFHSVTANSSDLYGHRLTVSFNSTLHMVLMLDGQVLQTSSNTYTAGQNLSVQATIVHPFTGTGARVSTNLNVVAGAQNLYLIQNGWGPVGRGMIEAHRRLLAQNQAASPGNSTAESVAGESLAILGYTWLAENSQSLQLTAQLAGVEPLYQHAVGIVGFKTISGANAGPYVDLPLNEFSLSQLSQRPIGLVTPLEIAELNTIIDMASVLESGTIDQTQRGTTAVSTVRLLDNASDPDTVNHSQATNDTIYDINNPAISGDDASYWTGTLDVPGGTMFSKYYSTTAAGQADLAAITCDVVPLNTCAGNTRVIAALHGPQAVGLYTGDGYFTVLPTSNGATISAKISGGMNGGFSTAAETSDALGANSSSTDPATAPGASIGPASAVSNNPGAGSPPSSQVSIDPVNLASGAFLNDHSDLTVGSAPFPYGLSLSRHYDSASRFSSTSLGLGWTHNFAYSVQTDSDGFEGMGVNSPISGASAIAALYVLQDIYQQQTSSVPLTQMIIGVQATSWLMDQLTNNVVNVVEAGQVDQFVKLADGSFNAPLGSNKTLTKFLGDFILQTADRTNFVFNPVTDPNGPLKLGSIHFAAGPIISFNYGSGKLTSVNNGMGRQLTFSYAGANLTSVSDGTRSVSYSYDSNNNLTAFQTPDPDPARNTINYIYDFPGRLIQVKFPSFPANAFVTNTYDDFDRVIKQLDPNQHASNFYLTGYRAETVDANNASDILYLGARGKTLTHIDAMANQTVNTYDGIDRLTQTTQPEGNYVTYVYDDADGSVALQNLKSATAHPKANVFVQLPSLTTSFTYDLTFNRVATVTDPNGNKTTNRYDDAGGTGNLTEIDQPQIGVQTPTTLIIYNTRGQPLTKTDPTGKVTTYAYSTTTSDLLSVTDDSGRLGLTTQYAYNGLGDVIGVTDPNGNKTTTAYDALRRAITVSGPASTGAVTNYTYNPDGLVTQTQRATGNVQAPQQIWTATYSPSGKIKTTTDPNLAQTNNVYGNLDRLAYTVDPANRVTTYAYDALGRRTKVYNPGIQSTPLVAYTFTPNGKLATLTDANNNQTGYIYDGHDRLVTTVFPPTNRGAGQADPCDRTQNVCDYEAYTYDANGNRLTFRRRDGSNIAYSYDVLNRPIKKQLPDNVNNVFLTYDLAGRVLSSTFNSPTGLGTVYAYDTAGRTASETTYGRALGFGYDAAGNRTRETWPDGFYVTYAYDALNRMVSANENGQTSGAAVLAAYTYDALGERKSVVRGNGTSSTYNYDPASRLLSLTHTQTAAGADNNLTLGFTYTAANQILTKTQSNDVYDWSAAPPAANKTADGLNRDSTVLALGDGYDLAGDQADDGTRKFGYDLESRLTSVSLASSQTSVVLAYDPLGRLQQEQATVGTAAPATTQFLYDGSRLSAEYDAAGNLLRRYVHGPAIDEPIVWYEYDTTGSLDRRWLIADERGSIIGQSDSAGIVTETYAYGPNGEPQEWGGSRFSYTGQIALPEVQLYDYKARAYDPIAGHFLQTDPIGYGGGANLYAYVNGDPLNLTDPSGNCSQPGFCKQAANGSWYATGQGPDPAETVDANGDTIVQEVVVTGAGHPPSSPGGQLVFGFSFESAPLGVGSTTTNGFAIGFCGNTLCVTPFSTVGKTAGLGYGAGLVAGYSDSLQALGGHSEGDTLNAGIYSYSVSRNPSGITSLIGLGLGAGAYITDTNTTVGPTQKVGQTQPNVRYVSH